MSAKKFGMAVAAVCLALAGFAAAQNTTETDNSTSTLTREEVDQLRALLKDHEDRIKALESQLALRDGQQPPPALPTEATPQPVSESVATPQDHMNLGSAPKFSIRGFADFNQSVGTGAN